MSYNPYLTEEIFFVAVKCCLRYEDTILVVSEDRPGKPLWRELPGGKISKDDRDISPLLSLARELEEELWLTLTLTEENTRLFSGEKSYEDTTFSPLPVPFVFLCYVHDLQEKPEIVLSHEHTSYEWIYESEISHFSDWRKWFDTIVRKAFQIPSKI